MDANIQIIFRYSAFGCFFPFNRSLRFKANENNNCLIEMIYVILQLHCKIA